MRLQTKNALLAILVLCSPTSLVAQSEIEEQLQESRKLLAQKQRRQAFKLWKAAHARAVAAKDERMIARCWHTRGQLHFSSGQAKEATKAFEQALTRFRAFHDGDHADVAHVMRDLGQCLAHFGKSAEALDQYEKALAMQRRVMAEDDARLAFTHRLLGRSRYALRQHAKALSHFEAALAISRLHCPDDYLKQSVEAYWVANSLKKLRRFDEARRKYEAALADRARIHPDGDSSTIDIHFHLGVCWHALGKYERALSHFEASVATSRRHRQDDYHKRSITASWAAMCLLMLRRFDEARRKYEAALADRARIHPDGDMSTAHFHFQIAVCWHELGEYERAVSHFDAVLALRRRLTPDDHVSIAETEVECCKPLNAMGRLDDVLERREIALSTLRRRFEGDHARVAEAMNLVGVALFRIGKRKEANSRFEAALAMQRRITNDADSDTTVRYLRNLGTCLDQAGRPVDRLPILEMALAMQRRLHGDEHLETATCLESLGSCLLSLGRNHEGLPALETSLAIRKRLLPANDPELARAHTHVGVAQMKLGKQRAAIDSCRASIAIFESIAILEQAGGPKARTAVVDMAHTQSNLALFLLSVGEVKQALEASRKSLATFERIHGDTHPDFIYVLSTRSAVQAGSKQYEEARTSAERALDIANRVFPRHHSERALILNNLGVLATRSMDYKTAIRHYEEAIAIVETLRSTSRGFEASDRQAYLAELTRGDPYVGLRSALVATGDPRGAFAVAERGRGRGLLDRLAQARFDPVAEAKRAAALRGDDATTKRLSELRPEITRTKAELSRLFHSIATTNADPKLGVEERAKRTKATEAQMTRLHGALRQQVREQASIVADFVPLADVARPDQIQAMLGPGEVLLYYATDNVKSHVFVVPPSGKIEVHELACQRPAIAKMVTEHLTVLSRGTAPVENARGLKKARTKSANGESTLARRLGTALVPKELWQRIRQAERVYLIPDGPLHRIPFETLDIGDSTGTTKPALWIDVAPPTAYAASASALRWVLSRAKRQKDDVVAHRLVAFADPKFVADDKEIPFPEKGALIAKVADGTQAVRIGLRPHDVLLAYDGKKLKSDKSLRRAMRDVEDAIEDEERKASDKIKLRVWRKGEELDFEVEPGQIGAIFGKGHARAAWKAGWGRGLEDEQKRLLREASVTRFGGLLPLPGTRREVGEIARAITGREDLEEALESKNIAVRLGDKASESELFELAPRGRYLHLATHGLVDEIAETSYSAVALSLPRTSSIGDDGFLKLDDLFGAWRDRLSSCQMVVLSACRTKVGPQQDDDAAQALPVGFLYAGASSVVASNWNVDDASTAELMADFYKRILAQGEKRDRLKAFTAARRALKKRYPEPFHWAPFVYIGSPR